MRLAFRIPRGTPHPFLVDILTTGITQAGILVANMVLVGVVGKLMGAVVLGEYLLVKRVSAWLLSGSQLGLGVAVPRQIARTVTDQTERARQYLAVSMIIVLGFIALIGTGLLLWGEKLSRWCFGVDDRSLVLALVLLLCGTGAHTMIFSYFRGLQRMQVANIISLGGLVIVPLLALAGTYQTHSAARLIGATGIGMAAVSAVWAAVIVAPINKLPVHWLTDARELIHYGLPRVPGDLAFGGLLTLGPLLISIFAAPEQRPHLLLGVTCLTMASVAFAPVGVVLLTKISHLLGKGRHEDAATYAGYLSSAVMQLSLVLTLQALIFTRPLILWWLGPTFTGAVPVIRAILVALPPYMYYLAMRSVVDAASNIAYNARNVMLALAVLTSTSACALWLAPRDGAATAVAIATSLSLYVLAFATHRTMQKIRLVRMSYTPEMAMTTLLPAAISLIAQFLFHFEISKIAFCMVMLLNLALLVLLTRQSEPQWVGFVKRLVIVQS